MRSWAERGALVLAMAIAGSVAFACSSSNDASPTKTDTSAVLPIQGRACPESSPLTYESFGAPFLLDYCTGCHSSKLDEPKRQGAPLGVDFDTLAGVRSHLVRAYERAADDHTTMPPAGGPSPELRKQLGDWLACGAPGEEHPFVAESSLPPPKPLDAECTDPVNPLPANLMPRCSAETYACIAACAVEDQGCEGRCIAKDTTPRTSYYGYEIGCSTCVYYQRQACADKNGCHSVNAQLECCRRDKCTGSTDPNCVVKNCAAEAYAYGYCESFVTPSCQDLVSGPAAGCFGKANAADGGAD